MTPRLPPVPHLCPDACYATRFRRSERRRHSVRRTGRLAANLRPAQMRADS